jgi:hypothetical protein
VLSGNSSIPRRTTRYAIADIAAIAPATERLQATARNADGSRTDSRSPTRSAVPHPRPTVRYHPPASNLRAGPIAARARESPAVVRSPSPGARDSAATRPGSVRRCSYERCTTTRIATPHRECRGPGHIGGARPGSARRLRLFLPNRRPDAPALFHKTRLPWKASLLEIPGAAIGLPARGTPPPESSTTRPRTLRDRTQQRPLRR